MTRDDAWAALYRLALLAYPAAFRDEFSGELIRIFEERLGRTTSRTRAAAFACFLIADGLMSGIAERARRRRDAWAWPHHASGNRSTRTQTMTWDSLRADVRLTLRQAGRAPLFAALTVASLALGIGANSAMFGVVQAVLLRPLPYGDPGALVMIWSDNTKNAEKNNPVSPANYEAFKAALSLADVEGMYSFLTPVQVVVGSEPEPVLVSQVTSGMFSLLGRSPILGRKFDDEGAPEGAMLSHQFWQRRFGGDSGVIGKTLSVSGAGASAVIPILGVMPADFTFPYGSMLAASGFTRGQVVDMWWTISRQRDPRVVDASGQPNRG